MRQMAGSESNVNSLRLVLTHILGMRKVCTTVVPNYFPGKSPSFSLTGEKVDGKDAGCPSVPPCKGSPILRSHLSGDKSRIFKNDLETKQKKSGVGHQKSGNEEIRNSLGFFCLFYVWLFLCLLTATNGDTIISGLKPR